MRGLLGGILLMLGGSAQVAAEIVFLHPNQIETSTTGKRTSFVGSSTPDAEVDQYLLVYLDFCQNRAIGEGWGKQFYPRYAIQISSASLSDAVYPKIFGVAKGSGVVFDPKTEERSVRGTLAELRNARAHAFPIALDAGDHLDFKLSVSSVPSSEKGLLDQGISALPGAVGYFGPDAVAATQAAKAVFSAAQPLLDTIFRLNSEHLKAGGTRGFDVVASSEAETEALAANHLTTGGLLVYDPDVNGWLRRQKLVGRDDDPDPARWSVDAQGRLRYQGKRVPSTRDHSYAVFRLDRVDTVLQDTDRIQNRALRGCLEMAAADANRLRCYDHRKEIEKLAMGRIRDWADLRTTVGGIREQFAQATTWIDGQDMLTHSDRASLKNAYAKLVSNVLRTLIRPRDWAIFLERLNDSTEKVYARDTVDLDVVREAIAAQPEGFWAQADAKL